MATNDPSMKKMLTGSCYCGAATYAVPNEFLYAAYCHCSNCDVPSIRPAHHIFVASKAPWHEITDDLPQYDEHA